MSGPAVAGVPAQGVDADERAGAPARLGTLARLAPWLAALAVLLAALVAAGGGPQEVPEGLPDAGAGTGWALPVVELAYQLTAAATVGALLAGAVLAPSPSRGLSATAFRCLRAASGWALAWLAATAALLVLSLSDTLGVGVGEALSGRVLRSYALELDQGQALLVTGAAALFVALCARWTLSASGASVLLGVAVLGVVPLALTGHSANAADHDIATSSLVVHVVAAAVWVGGLLAVVLHLRRSRAALRVAVPRYSAVALVCFAAVGLSGLLNAAVRLDGPGQLLTSAYGLLVLAKALALGALGWAGWRHRTRTMAHLAAGRARAFLSFALAEVVLMTSAVALGVALSRTPTPASEEAPLTSVAAQVLGYELPELTPARWLTAWRPDALVLGAVLLAAVLYAVGVRRLVRRGDGWPLARSASFAAGLLLVVWVTTGGPGVYGTALFSMHMVQHMVLTMVAPILLTLSAPVTLALRALPAAHGRGGDAPAGPREWLLGALHSRPVAVLTHPVVSFGIYVSTLYAFYFSPAFQWSMESHVAHLVMHAHFLGVGLLYLYPIIGVDPAPRRLPHLARMVLLFASMPFHAFFAIAVMGADDLFAGAWFSSLQLPWVDLYADQRLGGGIAWGFAELPALAVLAALFVQWYRADARETARADRRSTADGEAELVAYNARLAALAERSARGSGGA